MAALRGSKQPGDHLPPISLFPVPASGGQRSEPWSVCRSRFNHWLINCVIRRPCPNYLLIKRKQNCPCSVTRVQIFISNNEGRVSRWVGMVIDRFLSSRKRFF